MSSFIKQLGQVSIPVHDIAKSVNFYSEKLGLTVLYEAANMALLECGGMRLILSLPEKPEFDHPSSILYFNVDDLQDAYEAYKQDGITFVDEPHCVAEMGGIETWMAFFKDPENNTHALMSEIPVGEGLAL